MPRDELGNLARGGQAARRRRDGLACVRQVQGPPRREPSTAVGEPRAAGWYAEQPVVFSTGSASPVEQPDRRARMTCTRSVGATLYDSASVAHNLLRSEMQAKLGRVTSRHGGSQSTAQRDAVFDDQAFRGSPQVVFVPICCESCRGFEPTTDGGQIRPRCVQVQRARSTRHWETVRVPLVHVVWCDRRRCGGSGKRLRDAAPYSTVITCRSAG